MGHLSLERNRRQVVRGPSILEFDSEQILNLSSFVPVVFFKKGRDCGGVGVEVPVLDEKEILASFFYFISALTSVFRLLIITVLSFD